MPYAVLLAMQASGMIFDYMGTKSQEEINNWGNKIQEAGIEANINLTRLETETETVESMKNLRKNLGSQIAVYAARGTALGAGSALTSLNQSVGSYKADERTRRMNLMGKENQLRTGAAITRLNNMTENTKLWKSFGQRSLNRFGTSQFTGKFGLTNIGS